MARHRLPTPGRPRIADEHYPHLATGVGLAAYQELYFVAVTAVGVNVATVVCIGLAPILLAVAGAVRTRRRPPLADLTILGAALAGLGLVTSAGAGAGAGATSPRPVLGLVCATVSGTGYALTTVLSQRAVRTLAPLPLTAVTTGVAALALVPAAALTGLEVPSDAPVVLALAYLGPATTALAFALLYLGLRTTPTATAAGLTLLEVPAAAALAGVFLADPLPVLAVVGGLLMIGAVAAPYRRAAPAPATPSTPLA